MTTTAQYLKTLRRIPDDIVLSMATREIAARVHDMCVCGWAIREAIARTVNMDAKSVEAPMAVRSECESRFGGSWLEWDAIYSGVMRHDSAPLIEEAFVTRVMEAAGVAAR